jgi:hypothetical protein
MEEVIFVAVSDIGMKNMSLYELKKRIEVNEAKSYHVVGKMPIHHQAKFSR